MDPPPLRYGATDSDLRRYSDEPRSYWDHRKFGRDRVLAIRGFRARVGLSPNSGSSLVCAGRLVTPIAIASESIYLRKPEPVAP